jgi:hypothetical protein
MYIICFISLYYLNYIISIKEINGFVVAKCAVCAQFMRSLHAVYLSKKSDIG